MKELKEVLQNQGFTEVITLLNSGNIIFSAIKTNESKRSYVFTV